MKYKGHFILEFGDDSMEYTNQPDPVAYCKAFVEDVMDDGTIIPSLENFIFTGKITKVN